MAPLAISLSVFACILTVLILIRQKFGDSFEIKSTDIILALIPVTIWLLLTGQIQKLEYGDFKIETAFIAASNEPVAPQISDLPVEVVRTEMKGGLDQLEQFFRSGATGLVFQLGYYNYGARDIEEYLHTLSDSRVQYVLFLDVGRELIGIVHARELAVALLNEYSTLSPSDLAEMLKNSNAEALTEIPGLLGAESALRRNATKRSALERMEELQTDFLPVIDEKRQFVGVVEQSRLTSSLLIDVAKRLE